MCGRYYIEEDDASIELMEIIDEINRRKNHPEFKMSGEFFPGDTAPVIAMNRRMDASAFPMKWGYAMGNKLVFNARSESAGEKALFREGMESRRCLIPASNYFEWDKRHTKFSVKGTDGAPLLYMAGIYRMEENRPAFTILTRAPAEQISFLHDRMPVILPAEIKSDWLNPAYKAEEIIKAARTDLWAEET